MNQTNKKIILFDGICNLCNRVVQFIIRWDKKDQFRFAALQSQTGDRLIEKYDIKSIKNAQNVYPSIILIEDGNICTKSTAALRIFKRLAGLWSLLYLFIVLPRFIRNALYDLIANHRYRIFGKRESCMRPTPELKQKFKID